MMKHKMSIMTDNSQNSSGKCKLKVKINVLSKFKVNNEDVRNTSVNFVLISLSITFRTLIKYPSV